MSDNPHLAQPVDSAGAPLGSARAAAILIHGRGRDTADILALAEDWNLDGLACLAPAAAEGSWYPLGFMAPLADNQPWLGQALAAIDAVYSQAEAAGFDSRRIALVGFSQGACLACEYALQRPRRYGAVIAYTGGAIGPKGHVWPGAEGLAGTPVFLGTSDVDEWVPLERVEHTATLFLERGAEVDMRVYPGMEHVVCDDEIAAGYALLTAMIEA